MSTEVQIKDNMVGWLVSIALSGKGGSGMTFYFFSFFFLCSCCDSQLAYYTPLHMLSAVGETGLAGESGSLCTNPKYLAHS